MSAQAWQRPSRLDAIDFWWRSRALAAAHALREALRPSARRWPAGNALADAPVLTEQRTPLWDDGRADEFVLVAGKVQNLRVARRAFDAIEVPAGELLSFWRQLGRPSARRGFVEGREIREGCIVPTLAGGVCQLSNALATVAVRAGFELVERHAHSARIEAGGLPPDGVDATVFWNYLDLRLRAPHAWRLEVELSASELVLTIRGHAPAAAAARPVLRLHQAPAGRPVARGCLSCDETACFRHRAPSQAAQQGRCAVLLDGWTPEFAQYLGDPDAGVDRFVPVPARVAFWRGAGVGAGAGWPLAGAAFRARWAGLRRALWQRRWARADGGRRQASLIDGQRWLAQAHAARLRPEHTRLVVDQALLPHLERLGAPDGRQIEVLAGALPMTLIEARLDAAARRWPDDATLRDFRADPALAQAELRGFARAERVVTAHAELAEQLPAITRAALTVLPWTAPAAKPRHIAASDVPVIVFPASALARKGARELAAALRALDRPLRVRVLGTPASDATLWAGLAVEHRSPASDWLAGAHAVVLPAHVEHAPRALLRALAAGVPVIATSACGLGERAGLTTVEAGNVEALCGALRTIFNSQEKA